MTSDGNPTHFWLGLADYGLRINRPIIGPDYGFGLRINEKYQQTQY